MGFEGYLPLQKYNRPPLTWIYNLNAYHINHTQVHKIKEKFDLLNSGRENYPKSGNIGTVRKALQDVVIFPDAVCVTTFDPPTISVLPLAVIFVSPM